MNRGYTDSQYSDSNRISNFNQAGLEQAEQNYFIKYAQSGFTELNQNIRGNKKSETKIIRETNNYGKVKTSQNEVLKELKQQYEILRNLPIDDKFNIKSRPKREITSNYSSSIDNQSQLSSSKKSNRRRGSREAQVLALQKKQLEIVISNSMKKIQQLLTNEMQLKKTIHELRLQIEGKGGINNQYEQVIKNYKKSQKELNETIETLKMEIQKKNSALKELGEKIAYLQGEKGRRDSQNRDHYERQRQMDDMLRKEKDKTMNAELQFKRLQMQMQIFQKDKNSQISRLTRQLQTYRNIPERDNELIRRLQQQLRQKDHKYEILSQKHEELKEQLRNRPRSPAPAPDNNKKLLEQLIKQMKARSQSSSKDNNEAVIRALIDKLGTKKEEGLKNELSSIRLQMENLRRNSVVSEIQPSVNEGQLKSRIRELQKTIEEQKREKRSLIEQIDKLARQRDDIFEQAESHRRKIREYKETQEKLLIQIEQLSNFKIQLEESKMQNQEIKEKLQTIMHHESSHQEQRVQTKVAANSRELEEYQDQIRALKRKIDQLSFALDKSRQETAFHQNLLKQTHAQEISRVSQDSTRYKSLLRQKEEEVSRTIQALRNQIQSKNNHIENLNKRFQELEKINKENLEGARTHYQEMLKAEVNKHYDELQSLNKKVVELTQTNETYLSKSYTYAQLQRQVLQLRRLTRAQKRMNEAIDHLWQIKEAEYGNVTQILNGARDGYL